MISGHLHRQAVKTRVLCNFSSINLNQKKITTVSCWYKRAADQRHIQRSRDAHMMQCAACYAWPPTACARPKTSVCAVAAADRLQWAHARANLTMFECAIWPQLRDRSIWLYRMAYKEQRSRGFSLMICVCCDAIVASTATPFARRAHVFDGYLIWIKSELGLRGRLSLAAGVPGCSHIKCKCTIIYRVRVLKSHKSGRHQPFRGVVKANGFVLLHLNCPTVFAALAK